MNLLINEAPLLILPSLVKQVGLNEAVFLQQLHFRSLVSRHVFEGEKWVYKTYEDWEEEFGFWSRTTIRRIIGNLEAQGYVISTSRHNKIKADQTKWYRINYSAIDFVSAEEQNHCPGQTAATAHDGQKELPELNKPISKELKNFKKEIVGLHHDEIVTVVEYLNLKTGKQFKTNASSTRRLVNARLNEGYSVEDIKRVIDSKTTEWLPDQKFRNYLRPSTLFNASNFENYLNEGEPVKSQVQPFQPFELDFTKGEE
ncbi:conserved phage C-terminal domain-containing protein [Mammaliicoccus sciuri]|uniref:Phage conserved hypothetical protein C-terminal domain-containing protein n=1 Tax=Sporosarcina newyorkensis TaxID=759851 RepID=A0A1T4Y7Q4_9BACL|nr:conserved phage C-terminal domain-containing protein [Sporosarcina newyorkensis]SKA97827.1 phage conserved hypothetical protein, C-terminal domain-containing protein [Sporosarcina newyorkensis]